MKMIVFIAVSFVCSILMQSTSHATLFGQGDFGDSTFGSLSSISLDVGSDVAITLTPNGDNFEGSGSHTVTVTTNDAVGYRLYLFAPSSTNLTQVGGSGATIAASANSSPAALADNTWGFNTSGSTTNFQGVLSTPMEIKVTDEPATSGDDTDVYYGMKTDTVVPADTYAGSVTYTVVARFED